MGQITVDGKNVSRVTVDGKELRQITHPDGRVLTFGKELFIPETFYVGSVDTIQGFETDAVEFPNGNIAITSGDKVDVYNQYGTFIRSITTGNENLTFPIVMTQVYKYQDEVITQEIILALGNVLIQSTYWQYFDNDLNRTSVIRGGTGNKDEASLGHSLNIKQLDDNTYFEQLDYNRLFEIDPVRRLYDIRPDTGFNLISESAHTSDKFTSYYKFNDNKLLAYDVRGNIKILNDLMDETKDFLIRQRSGQITFALDSLDGRDECLVFGNLHGKPYIAAYDSDGNLLRERQTATFEQNKNLYGGITLEEEELILAYTTTNNATLDWVIYDLNTFRELATGPTGLPYNSNLGGGNIDKILRLQNGNIFIASFFGQWALERIVRSTNG